MQTVIRSNSGERVSARFSLTTPMFLGGADGLAETIRPPSLKGALRFWWRALNWGKYHARAAEQNPALSPTQLDIEASQKLHDEEGRLFGVSAEEKNGKQSGGQGVFLLTVSSSALTRKEADNHHAKFAAHNAARYLGYGLVNPFGANAGQLLRGCIDENQCFTVELLFRNEADNSILDALIAFGLLGGLGSRARHGLGSLTLSYICKDGKPIWQAPTNQAAYIQSVRDLLAKYPKAKALPPFSAFSENSRIDVLLKGETAYKVLNEFARGELMYRAWGQSGVVVGEKRFEADRDWSKGKRPADFHPRRVIFGLPHNYGKGTTMEVSPDKSGRRASPLLFHVHTLSENSFIGVTVLLKSAFLPADEKINAGGISVPAKIEWNLLHDFLDGNDSNHNPRFPKKEAV